MLKSLIAGVAAVSLTFASVAPVQAQTFDREEIGKLVIGLAAIAALNAALENRERDRARAEANRRASENVNRNRDSYGYSSGNLHTHDDDWRGNNGRGHGNNGVGNRVLPIECLRAVETRHGTRRLFMRRCLERNYRHVNRIPDRCEVTVRTSNGRRTGYDPHCLRDAGYRTDRRR